MLRNLFHVPIRIFERKLTNGEIEYWCQYQNIFGNNYGEKEEGKVKVVDSCYKRRW